MSIRPATKVLSPVHPLAGGTDLKSVLPPPARFDVWKVREDFPILRQKIHGKPLVYLDNAATSQKPQAVIDTLSQFYATENSNVHRGVHLLSQRATEEYEAARLKVKSFLNAAQSREIIFVRGTTEAINLVAQSYGRKQVQPGDEVIISHMEHHSNIVPWQILCEEKGAVLRVVPINDKGEFLLEEYEKLLNPRTRFVSAMDVQELDCDFYAFSGHKLYGPTGIGALYGKAGLLEAMPPYQGGGEMISSVSFVKTTYNTLPHKFEAGTPHIAGAIGLGAAIDYVRDLGLDAVTAHEQHLLVYATEAVSAVPGVRLVGTARDRAGVLSFVLEDVHPHDIGQILDQEGIAIRTGHHCCQPVMDRFHVPATARASFALYNTSADVDALVAGLYKVKEMFA